MVVGVPVGSLLAVWALLPTGALAAVSVPAGLVTIVWLLGVRHIPHDRVGLVQRLRSPSDAAVADLIPGPAGQARVRPRVLRGGLHFGLFPWMYRIHAVPLVRIGERRIGYIHARAGMAQSVAQTLGRVVDGGFLDAEAFLDGGGQRGRQRGILREGLHAVNLALFTVITEDRVYCASTREGEKGGFERWRQELLALDAFAPVVVGRGGPDLDDEDGGSPAEADSEAIGIVTVHDGAALETCGVIDLRRGALDRGKGHDDYQDPEAFFALGGRPGRQPRLLRDGTYYISRWFATVEIRVVERRETSDKTNAPRTTAPGVTSLLELLPGKRTRKRAAPRWARAEVESRWQPRILRNDSELRSRPQGRPWGTGKGPTTITLRPAARHSHDGRGKFEVGDVPGQARRGVGGSGSDRPVDDRTVEHGEYVLRLVKRRDSLAQIP
jgi:hypothetical protein